MSGCKGTCSAGQRSGRNTCLNGLFLMSRGFVKSPDIRNSPFLHEAVVLQRSAAVRARRASQQSRRSRSCAKKQKHPRVIHTHSECKNIYSCHGRTRRLLYAALVPNKIWSEGYRMLSRAISSTCLPELRNVFMTSFGVRAVAILFLTASKVDLHVIFDDPEHHLDGIGFWSVRRREQQRVSFPSGDVLNFLGFVNGSLVHYDLQSVSREYWTP